MGFYFAWVAADEPFGAAHLREDEKVLSFDLTHQEGQIPQLSIELENPHMGLLAPGRLTWCWFSVDGIPLFHGRLIALPTNLIGEVVTLEFLARPRDFLQQKLSLATSMKVLPYYDEIWIDPGSRTVTDATSPFYGTFDPDTILETYSRAWHVDRVTGVVSASEISFGEDGDEVFEPHEVPYDSVQIEFSQNPVMAVFFTGTVEWTQQNSGVITAVNRRKIGATDDFSNDWPKTGTDIGGGWKVAEAHAFDTTGESSSSSGSAGMRNGEKTHQCGDTMSLDESWSYNSPGIDPELEKANQEGGARVESIPTASKGVSVSWSQTVGDCAEGRAWSYSINVSAQSAWGYSIDAGLDLEWDMENGRKETIQFLLTADMQPIVTYPDDEPPVPEQLQLQGGDVGVALSDGSVPIGGPSNSAFFPSDRGLSAIQYPLLMARAKLLQSMRAVKITFDIPIERAVHLSCRKNAFLFDPRLPGGQALGKITEYHIKADGDAGVINATVQMECTIGNGGTVNATAGTPEYVEEAYVNPGYQFYDGESLILPTNDMGFQVLRDPLVGIVTPGPEAILTNQFNPVDIAAWQEAFNNAMGPMMTEEAGKADISLDVPDMSLPPDNTGEKFRDFIQQTKPTQPIYQLELKPVAGYDFETTYNLVTTPVVGPMMINLAAESTP